MSRERESRPVVGDWAAEISCGDVHNSLADGTPKLSESLDDTLPFGPSLYADVPDMDAFIRLTIRHAAAHIDVEKHRAAVKA